MEPLNILIAAGVVMAGVIALVGIGYIVLLVLIILDRIREKKKRKAAKAAPTGNYFTLRPTSFEELAKFYGWTVREEEHKEEG